MLTTMTNRICAFSRALCRYGAGPGALFDRACVLALFVGLMAGSAHGQTIAGWDSIGPPGGTVTAILTSPASASTLYAGTAENGVFVSSDAGAAWVSASAGLPATTAIGRQSLYAIYALATDGQLVYAATAAGLFYTAAGATPAWLALAPTASTTPITLLAFDPNTRRLFAASGQSDGVATPGVYVAQISSVGGPPAAWTFAALPAAPGTTVGAMTIVPATAPLTPASLLVGFGNNLYTASIDPVAIALNWVNGDSSASLAADTVTALAYSAEFRQAYACSGGVVFYSGNPLDAQAVWLQGTVQTSGASAFNCAAFLSVPIAVGGAPQVMLGTDQGAFVSLDGVNFAATGSLGVASSANAFAIAQGSGSPDSTMFAGTGFGVASTAIAALAQGASWSASNGPASVLAGGNNLRLNNANIVDSAVLGSTLYGAAVANQNQYVDVLYSHDGGASWSATHIGTVLADGEQIISLAADNAHSALYAATTQGLLAFSPTSARWSTVAPNSVVGRVGALALGTAALFVGTDSGLWAVPLSGAPDTALAVAAGLNGASVRSLLVAGGTIYAGTIDANANNTVYSATEAGAAAGTAVWSQFGLAPTGTDRITSLLRVGDNLLAATHGSLVLYASAGSGWASANTDPVQQISDAFGDVNSLYSDGVSIYAATGSNGVFVSPVGSTFSWTPMSGSGVDALPSLEVHTLRASGNTLYASTRAGIAAFAGLNGGGAPIAPATPGLVPMPSGSGGGAVDPLFVVLLLAAAGAVVAARRRS